MDERLLCKGPVEVSVGGEGDRALVHAKAGESVRFWCDTLQLEGALSGKSISLHAFRGSCSLAVRGDILLIELRFPDGTCYSATCATESLSRAVRQLRGGLAGG